MVSRRKKLGRVSRGAAVSFGAVVHPQGSVQEDSRGQAVALSSPLLAADLQVF